MFSISLNLTFTFLQIAEIKNTTRLTTTIKRQYVLLNVWIQKNRKVSPPITLLILPFFYKNMGHTVYKQSCATIKALFVLYDNDDGFDK